MHARYLSPCVCMHATCPHVYACTLPVPMCMHARYLSPCVCMHATCPHVYACTLPVPMCMRARYLSPCVCVHATCPHVYACTLPVPMCMHAIFYKCGNAHTYMPAHTHTHTRTHAHTHTHTHIYIIYIRIYTHTKSAYQVLMVYTRYGHSDCVKRLQWQPVGVTKINSLKNRVILLASCCASGSVRLHSLKF